MAKFRPLRDRVLVKRIEAEEMTPARFIIPEAAKEKPAEGKVLAVGPGTPNDTGKLRPLDVKINDHVLFAKCAGTEVVIGGSVDARDLDGSTALFIASEQDSTPIVQSLIAHGF
jgi:chaperonin GroES